MPDRLSPSEAVAVLRDALPGNPEHDGPVEAAARVVLSQPSGWQVPSLTPDQRDQVARIVSDKNAYIDIRSYGGGGQFDDEEWLDLVQDFAAAIDQVAGNRRPVEGEPGVGGTPGWAYDEDGYCVCCGNGRWKRHMPHCELRDGLDGARFEGSWRGRLVYNDDDAHLMLVDCDWQPDEGVEVIVTLAPVAAPDTEGAAPPEFVPMPEGNGGADFDKVLLVGGKPSCRDHGAMNKVTPSPPGFWRCLHISGCRAGCAEGAAQ